MNGPVLCEVIRGGLVESVHHGLVAVVRDGKLIYSKGDPRTTVFMRSSAKPLQAHASLSTGAAERFKLAPREIAVMCGSHEASDAQLRAAKSILRKIGLRESDLRCGPQPQRGRPAAPILNNCSGKHAGMLAACRAKGWRTRDYVSPSHPLQRLILRTVSDFSGVPARRIGLGVDGCSAPTFAMPLDRFAIAFERFFATDTPVRRAMLAHPEMVGQSCTRLIRAGDGRLLCKIGAEGVYGVAIPDARIGIAVKILDGSARPLVAVVAALARRFGVPGLSPDAVLRNWAGLETGRLRVTL